MCLLLSCVGSAVAQFDLYFEVLNPPVSAFQCQHVGWVIRVTNKGSFVSPNVCFLTGVVPQSGPQQWNTPFQILNFQTKMLRPGESQLFPVTDYVILCNAPLGRLYTKVETLTIPTFGCSMDFLTNGNWDEKPIQIQETFWDLRFRLVNPPTHGVTCSSVDWAIEVTNAGNAASQDVCFFSGIGPFSGPGNWKDVPFFAPFRSGSIPRGGSRVFPVINYQIPCSATPGQQYVKVEINYNPGACDDPHKAGNFAESAIQLEAGYWDLQFSIAKAPPTGLLGSFVRWDVNVVNAGTLTSMDVCFVTGIGLHSGPNAWADNLGLVSLHSGPIPPHTTETFAVAGYLISPLALRTQQYIKAEINYAAGCFDPFSTGNYADVPILLDLDENCATCPLQGPGPWLEPIFLDIPPPGSRPPINGSYYGHLHVGIGPSQAVASGAQFWWLDYKNTNHFSQSTNFLMQPGLAFTLHFGPAEHYTEPTNVTFVLSRGDQAEYLGNYLAHGKLELSQGQLWLIGSSGSTYRIESSPTLDSNASWKPVFQQALTSETRMALDGLAPAVSSNLFLRAVLSP
ncbi:MAG: hypothetical protein HY299_09355 [Verrucomicrobia bacterium]|nr:hypothetical protein [Verrucomicrobiota bacterium]